MKFISRRSIQKFFGMTTLCAAMGVLGVLFTNASAPTGTGGTSTVWGTTNTGDIYQYDNNGGWTKIPGGLSQVVILNHDTMGIDGVGQLLSYNNNTWTYIKSPNGLPILSVSGRALETFYVITGDNSVWQNIGGNWTNTGGFLKQISTDFASLYVVGVNSANQAFGYGVNGSSGWTFLGAGFSQLQVGAGQIWGLDLGGGVHQYSQMTQSWTTSPAILSQISVGYDGTVWGLNAGEVFMYSSGSNQWIPMGSGFSQIKVANYGAVWALDIGGGVHQYVYGKGWVNYPGVLANLAVGPNLYFNPNVVPPGSYQGVCYGVTLVGTVLSAYCPDGAPNETTFTTLDLRSCAAGDVTTNNRGALMCNGGVGTTALTSYSVPTGSYQQSCFDFETAGTTLVAYCANSSKQLTMSTLNFSACGTSDIANLNGNLVCNGAAGTAAVVAPLTPTGTYQQNCSSWAVRDTNLISICPSSLGLSVVSSLDLTTCQAGDISVSNGRLQCNGAKGTRSPGGINKTRCPILQLNKSRGASLDTLCYPDKLGKDPVVMMAQTSVDLGACDVSTLTLGDDGTFSCTSQEGAVNVAHVETSSLLWGDRLVPLGQAVQNSACSNPVFTGTVLGAFCFSVQSNVASPLPAGTQGHLDSNGNFEAGYYSTLDVSKCDLSQAMISLKMNGSLACADATGKVVTSATAPQYLSFQNDCYHPYAFQEWSVGILTDISGSVIGGGRTSNLILNALCSNAPNSLESLEFGGQYSSLDVSNCAPGDVWSDKGVLKCNIATTTATAAKNYVTSCVNQQVPNFLANGQPNCPVLPNTSVLDIGDVMFN